VTRIYDPSFRLREERVAPSVPAKPGLGLHLGTHAPRLRLADYIHPEGPGPPLAVSRPRPGFAWGMLANDRLGDCVIAMMLHSIEDFHLDAGTPPPPFSDADAISIYSAITGYDPADPASDQGTDEGQAMAYWRHPGLSTPDAGLHTIAGTVSVNPANLSECRIAIDEFDDLQLGAALPLSAQGQSEWTVVGDPQSDPNSKPGSWGGHGIPAREYDPETFAVVSWGAELLETTAFQLAYVQEAHVVVTQEMLTRTGVGPSGVDWDQLLADLRALPPAAAG
jgi:hypothetical protein